MKKAALITPALALAGLAQAQSSLTLFGVVDASVAHVRGSGPGAQGKWQLNSSGDTASRLGLRGIEDLGGGWTAGFWLDAGLQNDTGSGLATNSNNQASGVSGAGGGLTFNRRATVSLAGPLGEVRLGRDYVPSFWNSPLFEPFGAGGGVGSSLLYSAGLGGLTHPVGTRASNSIGYFLPPGLGGFYGQVMHAFGENASGSVLPGTGVSNRNDGRYSGARLGWQGGGLDMAVATGRTTYAAGNLRVTNLAASYTWGEEWGRLRLMGQIQSASLGGLKDRGWLVGLQWPVGNGQIKAAYARYRRDTGQPGPDPTASKLSLGYVHHLSKRSAVYGTVARIGNANGSAQALAGVSTAPGHAASGVEFGIRHSF